MPAMPAPKWSISDTKIPEVAKRGQLDLLIETAAYYRELAQEYPMTAFYHRMLETSEKNLLEAEKRKASDG